MSTFSQATAWIGAIYGGLTSAYLWVWYFSEILNRGNSPLSPLLWPSFLKGLLAIHFVIGLLAVLRLPNYWIPIGPPNQKFRLIAIGMITLALGSLIVFVPAILRGEGTTYFSNVLASIFLIQTTYIFAHFSTGYTFFSERRRQDEKLRVLLEAARTGNVSSTCSKYQLPEKVFCRWRAEFEGGVVGKALHTVELNRLHRR